MDKFEYKVKSEEIKALIAEKDFAQAAEIADTIDWRRVKSVMMLCTISDLYKINRRYEDAKNMLLLAYDRRQGGRTICYSLCELCIKTGDYVQALKFYKEFTQVAPKDPGKYVLQYKLYEAQDVQLEERIAVLEELKKRDYREKWGYELAYLYHRVGLATRCVEECDELILWFGEGKYVVKAMELKMLHHPLTPSQQELYDRRFEKAEEAVQSEDYSQEEFYEPPVPVEAEQVQELSQPQEEEHADERFQELSRPEQTKEFDIQVKTVDVGQYNTINLQEELAAGLQEVLEADSSQQPVQMPKQEQYVESAYSEKTELNPDVREEIEGTEVFFGGTGEIEDIQAGTQQEELVGEESAAWVQEAGETLAEPEERIPIEEPMVPDQTGETEHVQTGAEDRDLQETPDPAVQPPKELADVLLMESNGQIRMVLPENMVVEKQITGQMKIEDILAEWERMKKENKEKYQEEIRNYVLRETGPLFTEFDAAVRDGLLEKLENGEAGEEKNADAAEQIEEPAGMETEKPKEALEAMETGGPSEIVEPECIEEDAAGDGSEEYRESEYSGECEEGEEFVDYMDSEYADEGGEGDGSVEYMKPEYIEGGGDREESADYGEPEYVEGEEALGYGELEYADEGGESVEYMEPEYTDEGSEPAGNMEPEYIEEAAESEETTEPVDRKYAKETGGTENAGYIKESEEEPHIERDKAKVRSLSREEKELFGPFIQSRHFGEQLVKAIDSISMAAYAGNVIVTGEEGMDTLTLAKNIIREVSFTDRNFSGKVAKITGQGLNGRDIGKTLEQQKNGALIIQKASGMSGETAEKLHKELQQERVGIVVVLEDTRKAMQKLLSGTSELEGDFTARVDLEALSNDTLVSFGRRYAREKEYSIDDLGILALHTRIEENQTIDHAVTVLEVKQMVDDAIRHASRKTLGHFFDVLLARRYDDEDMIILTEKDFVA